MSEKSDKQWFVMRDLTRPIAKRPAYVMLEEMGIEYYTPMVSKVVIRGGKRVRKRVPFLHDLIFVHATRSVLDPIVETPLLPPGRDHAGHAKPKNMHHRWAIGWIRRLSDYHARLQGQTAVGGTAFTFGRHGGGGTGVYPPDRG